ncbi:AbrB/MazE/SpoVT family DNA-binding domain-containing protein [Vulcanisaeta distributa]|uniref:SpoVT/AbrB domain protein n=1 Tax=Vulcanisaeta distributa (strain DSM 14429 / JCM 11212 / NBRC 100878 / IC-017) TaxID=572478 RepID=E1QR74_VULDI|nr:AbrB/MazE/SpoVT family DNA-binding domain-containing protein [Vulcanisaeta distributa]ADN51764.1 SpoVT/AbrB domain protein [Vulcanisaeta distributa DSM 14429]
MASGISRVRRVRRSMVITKLPYVTKIYINYQVLIPASLVKALNIENVAYANITIKYRGLEIEIPQVRLLRTRNTASRQFTIPKEVREKYGISPLDEVEVLDIKPA